MKKNQKILCYILITIFFGCSNVYAKSTLLTCNYDKPYDSLSSSPAISVLCNIYTDYSHKCYAEINNGSATTKSNKYSIKNWNDKIKLDWKAKDYVEEYNKCPSYLSIYFVDKIGGIYAGATEEEANQIASSGFNNGATIFIIQAANISNTPEKIEEAREKTKKYTDHMRTFVNDFSVEKYEKLSDCRDALDRFKITMNNYKNEVNNFIITKLIDENDFLIAEFNGAYSGAEGFLPTAYEAIDKKNVENENIQKDKCEQYTYDECLKGKQDINGKDCIVDANNGTCKTMKPCSSYTTEEDCPTKSDYGKCRWNNDTNTCDKVDTFVCTDYQEHDCPNYDYDEEGNLCYYNDVKGCTFLSNDDNSISLGQTTCSSIFTGKFGDFLKQIYSFMKFIVPIIILVFAIIDFIKAVASGDPAEMKKAATKLVKRLAIGIAIFILPTLVELILAMAGIEFGTCGIS